MIQGFGNVGSHTAVGMANKGYKIIALSDVAGGVISEDGISIDRVLEYVRQAGTVSGLPSLIISGEGEHLEFKASVRWDFHQDKVNRALEIVIAKTIVGFMNHRAVVCLSG